MQNWDSVQFGGMFLIASGAQMNSRSTCKMAYFILDIFSMCLAQKYPMGRRSSPPALAAIFLELFDHLKV